MVEESKCYHSFRHTVTKNNCFQITVMSWLLQIGQHLYKITQIYKNMKVNTFTNVLTFC